MHQTRETLMNSRARLVPRTILKSRWSSRQGQLRREERRWIAGNGNLVEPLNTRHGGGTSIGLDLASLDLEWFNLRLPLLQKRGMHCTCRDMVKFRQSAENAWSGSKQATVFGILDRWLAPSFWLKFGNRQKFTGPSAEPYIDACVNGAEKRDFTPHLVQYWRSCRRARTQ